MNNSANARILIVDDEPGMRSVLTEYLVGYGYQTVEAPDGRVALGILQEGPVDLAIVDVFMPVMDGIQLLSEIRARSFGTRVIAVSGGGANEYPELPLRTARFLGALAVLEKPLDLDVLRVEVERCLEVGLG